MARGRVRFWPWTVAGASVAPGVFRTGAGFDADGLATSTRVWVDRPVAHQVAHASAVGANPLISDTTPPSASMQTTAAAPASTALGRCRTESPSRPRTASRSRRTNALVGCGVPPE